MCSDCRPTQAQHSGSISTNASVTLLDVLCQVPVLPEKLDAGSQKALSATCKSCRLKFTAQVQIVTVAHEQDCALVFQRRWPQLCMVVLQRGDAVCALLHPSSLIRTTNLQISAASNTWAAVSMLRPLQRHDAIDLPWAQLAAHQLGHQMRFRWPSMALFKMSLVRDLDGLGLEIISQLVKGTWTQLVHLSLSDCNLKAEGFLILSQGIWPSLKCLDVSGNCLDAEGMALLAKGNWPLLTFITLSFDPTTAAIAHLSAANWRITKLVIKHTPFSADMAAELADLQFPNLSTLVLRGSGLTAAAVSELARADWPSLTTLSLDHDDLDAMAVLLGLDLEKVQKLESDACDFTVSQQRMPPISAQGPDMVLWPHLSFIMISKRSILLL